MHVWRPSLGMARHCRRCEQAQALADLALPPKGHRSCTCQLDEGSSRQKTARGEWKLTVDALCCLLLCAGLVPVASPRPRPRSLQSRRASCRVDFR
jgi:hypothetical protein